MDSIESTVSGIPCQVVVAHFIDQKPDHSCTDSDLDYHGYTEIEFEVFDRKGYRAKWLEAKLTDEDVKRIEAEILAAHRDRGE